MKRRYDHDLSVQGISTGGIAILSCAHAGCYVIWWPERKKPVTHCPGAMLIAVAAEILVEIQARVAEIGDGTGCEAGAARAYERGRFDVVAEQMWKALGLPTLDAQPAGARLFE